MACHQQQRHYWRLKALKAGLGHVTTPAQCHNIYTTQWKISTRYFSVSVVLMKSNRMNILNYNKLNNKNREPSKDHMMCWRRSNGNVLAFFLLLFKEKSIPLPQMSIFSAPEGCFSCSSSSASNFQSDRDNLPCAGGSVASLVNLCLSSFLLLQ